ncbi:hypothetical protein ABW20_dc0109716 [Dactylellina cionopaga]|nr:hypothetical protein ABW20_dc0109716 [Dactylellina cionopaga]
MSLSEKVFHLWKYRNEAARSDEFAAAAAAHRASLSPSTPAFSRQPETMESTQAQQSIGFRPLVPFQIPPPDLEARSAPPAPMPATPNVSDGRRSIEILSPARTSDIIGDRPRMDDASPQISAAPPSPLFQEQSQGDPNVHLPGVLYEANPFHLSEIWRGTIYRLYAEQNEALTKYRRPKWLFHLDSHGIRTVGDLGGWRGDDESTRQLAANLITKLQETGYGTKDCSRDSKPSPQLMLSKLYKLYGRAALISTDPVHADGDANPSELASRDPEVSTTPARPASTPARPASTPGIGDISAQTGFTPINRSVSNPLMPPPQPPGSFEQSVEKRNSIAMIMGENARSPGSTIEQVEADEFQADYDGMGDDALQYKLQDLNEGLEQLKREMKEAKRSFTRDFHEDYCTVRNVARENRQRIEKLEADTTRNLGGGESGAVVDDRKQKGGVLIKRVGLLEERMERQFDKDGALKVERLEEWMTKEFRDILSTMASGETLAARVKSFDLDMKQRVGRLEMAVDALDRDFRSRPHTGDTPASPITRRSSRSSAPLFGTPDALRVGRMETEMKQQMEKLEVKVEGVNTEVKEKIEKMESKIESIDNDVKEIMNAVSALLKQAIAGGLPQSKPNGLRFGNSGK